MLSFTYIRHLQGTTCTNIGIRNNEKGIVIWTPEDRIEKNLQKGEIGKASSIILEKGHYEALLKQKCKEQSFETFSKSNLSNLYVDNCKISVSNRFIWFSLRRDNETLWTGAFLKWYSRTNLKTLVSNFSSFFEI